MPAVAITRADGTVVHLATGEVFESESAYWAEHRPQYTEAQWRRWELKQSIKNRRN